MSIALGDTLAAVPASVLELAQPTGPSGRPDISSFDIHGLGSWIENFRKYEATLRNVMTAAAGTEFKDELGTVFQWYNGLESGERTASVYMLLQRSDQDQIRFYISVLQQMIKPDVSKTDVKADDEDHPSKLKPSVRNARPPSLNLPSPGSPIPSADIPSIPKEFATASKCRTSNRLSGLRTSPLPGKDEVTSEILLKKGLSSLPGLEMMSARQLNLIATAGLSQEAQILAVQLIMNGLVQPVGGSSLSQRTFGKKTPNMGDSKNWRCPASARYPANVFRGGLRTATLKSAGVKSAGVQSAGLGSAGLESGSAMPSPREEDFDPVLLNDISKWLRSLRLHKYTTCFDGLTWQEMVVLDDNNLKDMGVVTQGARGRLLRSFEFARKKMGISSTGEGNALAEMDVSSAKVDLPHSSIPTSKLSISSPIFVPSFECVPHSATSTLSCESSIANATDEKEEFLGC